MMDVLRRLYRTKLVLSCVLLIAGGIILMALAKALSRQPHNWLVEDLPIGEIGGILLGAGLLGVWLDKFLEREQDAVQELRLRQLLQEHAPAMRDAVLEAFAANEEDLRRVATPETLDRIIGNSLAIRLGDEQFAHEVYGDIRQQAIGASERWHDAQLSIDLSPLPGRQHHANSLFAVTVRWEYTTIPHHAQRRFACVDDRDEYVDLAAERGATSAWYLGPSVELSASSADAFELVSFSVDGEPRTIRRSVRKTGQHYSANVGAETVATGKPVKIAYTYRTVTAKAGHLLFFDIEQPTRDLSVEFNYSGCGIESVSVLDMVPSVRPTTIEPASHAVPGSVVRANLEGWIFPRSGIAFVWTISSERRADAS